MIYRVFLKINYYERWFDFADVQEAALFAETILTHQVPNEDNKDKQLYVRMQVMTKEEAIRSAQDEDE